MIPRHERRRKMKEQRKGELQLYCPVCHVEYDTKEPVLDPLVGIIFVNREKCRFCGGGLERRVKKIQEVKT